MYYFIVYNNSGQLSDFVFRSTIARALCNNPEVLLLVLSFVFVQCSPHRLSLPPPSLKVLKPWGAFPRQDEPTGDLDTRNTVEIMDLLLKVCACVRVCECEDCA